MKKLNEKTFRRIFITHYVAILVLVINGSFWTESLISMGVQYFLAFVIFLHNLDDRYLVKTVVDYYKELSDKITYDSLTGLLSRFMITENFFTNTPYIIIMIDIDKFSKINDVYGNEIGNKVLLRVSEILKQMENCKIFRFNGDVFVLCLKEKLSENEVIEMIKNISKQVNKNPLIIDNKEFFIDLTYGISIDKNNSIENAELALNNAKISNETYAIYQPKDKDIEKSKQFFYYKNKVKWAIENGKIVMVYQGIVDKNFKLIKYEALVRIKDENGNLISPYFFLEVAKQTKQYDKLSEIALVQAIYKASQIEEKLSLNFSYRDVLNKQLLDKLETLIIEKGVANRLVLEILETERVTDYQKIIDFIIRFKKLGCKVALDDYGSGYSSFEYILKMDLDYIKIDASLIKNINRDEKSRIVVQTIIEFAKKVNMKTIAEFVENEEICKVCKELGVDEYQGYYFSKPSEKIG